MSSVVVKSIDEVSLRRLVDQYAARLFRERPDVEEVVVFGSFAAGTYAPGSDIDLVIVLARADRPVHERISDLLDLLPPRFPVGVDLFPYTRAELRALEPSALLRSVDASRWRYRP